MNKLKNGGSGRTYPKKYLRDSDGNNNLEGTSCDSNNDNGSRDSYYKQDPLAEGTGTESNGSKFTLSKKGKAFLRNC